MLRNDYCAENNFKTDYQLVQLYLIICIFYSTMSEPHISFRQVQNTSNGFQVHTMKWHASFPEQAT